MLVVGLTGGIGVGKSVVSQLFSEKGIPIIDADLIAKELTEPNQPTFFEILNYFKDKILLENGCLNRAKIRDIIFTNSSARLWLEKLLHPLIRDKISQQIAITHAPYCIVVIPLLIEGKAFFEINRILVVDSEPKLQIKRVKQRDNASSLSIESIIKVQAVREKRLKAADEVILNNDSIQELALKVEKLHQFYTLLISKN